MTWRSHTPSLPPSPRRRPHNDHSTTHTHTETKFLRRHDTFHNLRLLKRMKKPSYTEPRIAWGDADEIDVDSSRVTKYEYNKAGAGPSKLLLK